jgi:signal peptidase
MRAPRLAAGLALWLVLGLIVGTVLAAGTPVLFGLRSFTVMSGSMEPVLDVGDVVVTKPVVATDVRVGDVITFPDEERDELVTHRVRSIHLAGSRASIETRGDANDASEHWSVPADGRVGRVAYHLPLVGYALVWTHGRLARLLLIVIPALLLGALELRRIWRPRAEVQDAAA